MGVRGRERTVDREHPARGRPGTGAEHGAARADARRGQVGLDPRHIAVRALFGDAAVEEDVHLASRARAVLVQRVVAVEAAVQHVEVHRHVRAAALDVEARHVEGAVRAHRHVGMARIGEVAAQLVSEQHRTAGRVAGALDHERAAVHEDARVRARIVTEADPARVVQPQFAAMHLDEGARPQPDRLVAVLRIQSVGS